MTKVVDRRAVWHRPWLAIVLESVVAAAAIYGAVGLIWDNAIGMTADWLTGTPFTSWTLPGLLLLIVVALPMGCAAVLELRRSPWATASSVAAGAAQIGWIVAQLAIMQRYFFLQPVMALYSRRREYEADAYATQHANAGELVTALVKLYQDNAATLTPDPMHSAFYDSHPPAALRIARLKGTA